MGGHGDPERPSVSGRRTQPAANTSRRTPRPTYARDVAIGLDGGTDLERVLNLIVQRGHALIEAEQTAATGSSPAAHREMLQTFTASAAAAVAMAQSVESDRVRSLMAAGDAERTRWARELHDETLQGLGAIRLLLAAARRRADARQTAATIDEAIEYIQQEIENLHAIISDLRPAALDELGLRPALEALLERRSSRGTLKLTSALVLPDPQAGEPRLEPAIESTVYRVVQEALTNIVKHANARTVRVAVNASAGAVSIEVEDDGIGFAAGRAAVGVRSRGNARARRPRRRDPADRLRRRRDAPAGRAPGTRPQPRRPLTASGCRLPRPRSRRGPPDAGSRSARREPRS